MAQDELIYRVVLVTDEESVKQVQEQLNDITRQAIEAQQKAQQEALGGGAEQVDSLKRITDARQANLKSLIDLQKQQEAYKSELKELALREQIQGELTDEQATRQQELKLAVKAASSEYNRQQRDIIALSSSTNTLENTYEGLVAQNKALMAEMRRVPLDDTSGKLGKLQAQYKANNDRLKDFDKSLGNHQRNVGNYASALDDVGGKLGQMPGPIGRASSAFSTFSAVLKANPLILVATLLAGLLSTLSRVQGVTDAVTAAFQGLNATLNVVGARLAKFGSGLLSIVTGNFREGFEAIKDSISGIGTEIVEVARAGFQAERMIQALARARNTALVREAELTRDIANARLQAQDAELSTQERLDAINRAIELNQRLAQSERSLARAAVEAAQEKLKTDTDDLQLQTELAQARANLVRVETDLANRQRELFERRNTLGKQLADEDRKAADEALAREQEFADLRNRIRSSITDATAESRRKDLADFVANEQAKAQAAEQSAQKQIEIEARIAAERKALARGVYDLAFNLSAALFGRNKAVGIAQALVDTYVGAQAAFKDTPGDIFTKSIAAGAAIAQGLARVRAIQSTDIGSSGGGAASASSAPVARGGFFTPASPTGTGSVVAATIPASAQPTFVINATVDRRGIALAVRDGEAEIKSDQITFSS